MTQTATIGRSNVHHNVTITCGAVHYRTTRRGDVKLHTDAEVTCTKCLKAAPVIEAAPEAEAPIEPLTFMQRQRLAGKAR